MHTIAFVGGSAGGKTKTIQYVAGKFAKTYDVRKVPEAYGVAVGIGATPSAGNIKDQVALFRLAHTLEESASIGGKKNTLILCDRGSLDSVAHMDFDARPAFLRAAKTTVKDEYKRYDAVVHLLSAHKVRALSKKNNAARNLDPMWADELDKRTSDVWGEHPHYLCFAPEADFDTKVVGVVKTLKALL